MIRQTICLLLMIVIIGIRNSYKNSEVNNNLRYMGESFICSGCKKDLPRALFHEFASGCRKKPVTSKCRECRKEEYYSKRYSTVCICCLHHRPLNSNAQCKLCNTESGLRECKKCLQILPMFLMYYGASKICKNCQKK